MTVSEAGPGMMLPGTGSWISTSAARSSTAPRGGVDQGEFRFRPCYLKAVVGEEIRGVLPLFEVPVPLRRRSVISVPFAV